MLNIFRGRRDLAITVVGRAVSAFGDGVAIVALILRLQENGAQPYEIGLLMGVGGIPQLFLAGPVGRLVDARDSRHLLVAGGLTEVAVTIPLIFVHAVVPVLVLVALLGCATTVTSTTWSALLPRVAGEDHVAQAISAQQSLQALTLVAAPAVGGLLAGAFGAGLPLAIDAATFAVVTLAGLLVRTRRVPSAAAADADSSGGKSGFSILRADTILAPLLVGVSVVVLLVGMADVVLVFLIRETLHAGGAWYGVAEAAWMAGIVAGALGGGRMSSERSQVRATIAGVAVACFGVAGFAASPGVGVLIAFAVIGGIGNGYAVTCVSTLLMTRTAEMARGRVSAAANVLLNGAQGASLVLGSCIAVVLSPRAIYALAGMLGLLAAGAVAVVGAARERHASAARRTPHPT